MLALPYITEYSGFRGRILITEPVLQIGKYFFRFRFSSNSPRSGRQLMEEMVHYYREARFSRVEDVLSSLPSPLLILITNPKLLRGLNQ
jgi:hypothetical protein